jgi:DNA-binding MarR family transcriptional regulator
MGHYTNMTDNQINQLVDSLFAFVPVLFRKMHKLQAAVIGSHGITYGQIRMLFILKKKNKMSMSELGEKLNMQKPNVTAFVDKLIEQGLVERVPNADDRRVIFIGLTEDGTAFIKNHMKYTKNFVIDGLKKLDNKDLKNLQSMVVQLNGIVKKLENGDKINELTK